MHITISISLHSNSNEIERVVSKFPISYSYIFEKKIIDEEPSWRVSSSTNTIIYHKMGFREDKLATALSFFLFFFFLEKYLSIYHIVHRLKNFRSMEIEEKRRETICLASMILNIRIDL